MLLSPLRNEHRDCLPCSGKKNKFRHFVVVVQLVHRLMQADISCTTTARLFFFPLLADYHAYLDDLFCDGCGPSGDPARQPDARAYEEHGQRRPGRHDGQEAADQRQTAAHRAAPASHHLRDTRPENLMRAFRFLRYLYQAKQTISCQIFF